jgi:4-amino-4-deoxy-L-arabinose transferase-like glycosyltransferase
VTEPRSETEQRVNDSPLLGLAAAKLLLHLTVITQYGWFRDELYYMASTRHLDWGYVEHPPLSIAVLTLVRLVFGESLVAMRLVPALAGAATVFLTGRLARALGGGPPAQTLAALAALLSPVFLGTNHYYSMNSLDLLLWTAAALVLLRCLDRGSTRHWALLGVVLGLGLLNKISVLWLGAGIAAGLLVSGYRRVLVTPGPWLALAIAAALFAPHVAWQMRHDWPTLEFMRNATARKMVDVPAVKFVVDQVLSMNLGSAPIWIAGLFYGLFGRSERGRVLAIAYAVVFAILIGGGRSRASYLAPAYPMLLALGGVAIERASTVRARRWIAAAAIALPVALGSLALPFALPILPPSKFIRYQAALGMAPRTDERLQLGALPQHYADMFGWPQMVLLVHRAMQRLSPEERAHVRVFGQNYGEAGAVDVLGRRYHLPPALSGHNSYWLWGPGDWDGSVLIIIGGDRADNAAVFEEIEIVGQIPRSNAMPYEQDLDVSIGRRLKMPPSELWPRLKHFI